LLLEKKICISLCSYNGEDFLEEQIESILLQSEENLSLIIRDDKSSDSSNDILEIFRQRDSRVSLSNTLDENLGAKENFSYLLKESSHAPFDYFALSDQDDVWIESKLALQLSAMQQIEARRPLGRPIILVHSDLEVVNASLDRVAPSLMKYQGIHHEPINPLCVLLAQNFVTGCTILMNRELLDFALPVPEEALMHDWWLALCAAVFGHIEYIDEPLVKYRQHGKNEVGAKNLKNYLNPFKTSWVARWFEGRDNLFQSMKQAQALAERIREHDPENPHLNLVESYASLQFMSPLKRIKRLRDLGVHAQSTPRQTLLISRLLLTAKVHHA